MSTELELVRGRTYRAKKPANSGGVVNDRTLLHVGMFEVQYDGPAVPLGRKYPKVTIEAFRKWADRDVTDELPPGEYVAWPLPKAASQPPGAATPKGGE